MAVKFPAILKCDTVSVLLLRNRPLPAPQHPAARGTMHASMLAAAVLLIDLLMLWVAGLAGALGLIALLIAITFVLARAFAGRRNAPLALWVRLKLWSGEIAAAWSVFFFTMPFERWLIRRDVPATRAGSAPVLLIHGYVNNAGAMWRLWKALVDQGFGVYTLNLEPVYADIDAYAPLIAARIAAIRAATGAADVTLVGHSMGGLAARAYLRACARQQTATALAKVITLGSPHHGTALARFEVSANGRQMKLASPWLAALATDEGGVWPCPLVSIYSLDDNVVAPQLSAYLDGARNIALSGIGHISLPLAQRAIALVVQELTLLEAAAGEAV